MRFKSLAVAAAIALGAAVTPQVASAAALPGAKSVSQSHVAGASLLEEVRHRRWHRHRHHRFHHHHHHPRFNRCSRVRNICASNFGWRSPGYRRCVINRGCW